MSSCVHPERKCEVCCFTCNEVEDCDSEPCGLYQQRVDLGPWDLADDARDRQLERQE